MTAQMSFPGLFLAGALALPVSAPRPFMRVEITPDLKSGVRVEASIPLQNGAVSVKDIGRGERIRWTAGRKDLPFQTERKGDVLRFRGLPVSGRASLSYEIRAFASYFNFGDRQRLREGILVSPDGFLALTGFFPCIEGHEDGLVDIRWKLPSGWKLIAGKEGLQPLSEAQESIWVAGRAARQKRDVIEGTGCSISVLQGATLWGGPRSLEGMTAYFRYAWEHFGPLKEKEFQIFLFPRGLFKGYLFTRRAVGASDELGEHVDRLTREMLRWWSGSTVPYWFREGVRSYIDQKVRVKSGLNAESIFDLYLRSCLAAYTKSVAKSEEIVSLAAISDLFPRKARVEEIDTLGALVAYKLDREIRAYDSRRSLDDVFAAVARDPDRDIDLRALIKKETGYDPDGFFNRYITGIIPHPEELLK